jgi:hypothetical protein
VSDILTPEQLQVYLDASSAGDLPSDWAFKRLLDSHEALRTRADEVEQKLDEARAIIATAFPADLCADLAGTQAALAEANDSSDAAEARETTYEKMKREDLLAEAEEATWD